MRATQYILPVVAGFMSGMILQTFGEQGVHALYPLPTGVGLGNPVALEAFLASLPAKAFLLLLANYVLCAFIAGIIATLIIGRKNIAPAFITGALLTLASIYSINLMPHQPLWFTTVSLLSQLSFALLGYLVTKSRKKA